MNHTLATITAGGLSGLMVDIVLYPVDTMKTYLQTHASHRTSFPLTGARFYRGLGSAMLASFPSAATFWTIYDMSKSVLVAESDTSFSAVLGHMGAAAAADTVVCLVRNPFEVVKQQMQAGRHKGVWHAAKSIVAVDGVRGLYAGYFSTVAREIPFDALQFAMYEELKRAAESFKESPLVLWENAVLGSIAGGFAAALTTPLDVVKTRLMTQSGSREGIHDGTWKAAFQRIVKEEGVRGLFAGIKPRVTFIGLGGAIFIGSFEEFRRRMLSESKEKEKGF